MNDFFNKFGVDKFAHLGIGGLICACITNFLMLQEGVMTWSLLWYALFASACVFVISVWKEYFMDSEFDWNDIIAAMIGCVLYILASAAGYGLYVAAN